MVVSRLRSKKLIGGVVFALICISIVWASREVIWSAHQKVLRIHCASVLKPVMEKIIPEFEKTHHIKIRIEYSGSGVLLEQIKLHQKSDLYIPAAKFYLSRAEKDGLVSSYRPVAQMHLVIATQNKSKHNISSLKDLSKLSYVICDERAGVGHLLKQTLEPLSKYELIKKNAKAIKPTVSLLAGDVKLGSVDAAIIWDTTAKQFGLRLVHIDEFKQAVGTCYAIRLRASAQPKLAEQFIETLNSTQSIIYLKNAGFKTITH